MQEEKVQKIRTSEYGNDVTSDQNIGKSYVNGKLPEVRASLNGDRHIPESSRFEEMLKGLNDKVKNKDINSNNDLLREQNAQKRNIETFRDQYDQNSKIEISRDLLDQNIDEDMSRARFEQNSDEDMSRARFEQNSDKEIRDQYDQNSKIEISRDWLDQNKDEEKYKNLYDQNSGVEMSRVWNDKKRDEEISKDRFDQFCDEEMYRDRHEQYSNDRVWNDQMKNENMCNNYFDQEVSRYENEQLKDEEISTNWFVQNRKEMISKDLFGQYMNEEISRNWHDQYNTKEKLMTRDQFGKYSNEGISQAQYNQYDNKVMPTDRYDQYGNKVMPKDRYDQYGNKVIPKDRYDQYGNKVIPRDRYDQYGNKVMPRDRYDQYANKVMPRDRYDQYGNKVMPRDRYDQYANKVMPRDRYDQCMNKEMSRNRYAHYSDEGMIQVRYGKYDNEETSTDECEQYKNDRTSRGHGQQYDDSKLTQNSSDKLGPNNYGGRKHTLTETVQNNDCKLQAVNVPEKTKHLKDTDNSFNKKQRNLTETYDYQKIDQHARQAPSHLNNSAEELVAYLSSFSNDPRMLARGFFVWITENIEYDDDGYFGRARSASNDAESVMKTGKSVCEGYARVFNLLCSEAGIPVKKVSGFSKGYGYSPSKQFTLYTRTDHAWNAVQLEGKWYLLDSTWGAGHHDRKSNMFKKKFDDFYFLTDPKQFVSDHFPYMDDNLKESQKWQLLSKPISLEEFNINVKYSPQAFKIGVRAVSHTTAYFEMKNELHMEFKSDKRKDITLSSELVLETRRWLKVQRNATFDIQENGVHKILVHPRQTGDYQLSIFGELASDDKSDGIPQIIKYKFKCIEVEDKTHEYPKTYEAASDEKCILHEPLKGNLPENTEIQFRITAPYLQHIRVEDTYLEKHGTLFSGRVTSPPKGYRFTMYGKKGEKYGISDALYAFHIT